MARVAFLLLVLAVAVQARQLQQAKYKTVADALSARENSQLSTLLAAVKAAGLSVPDDASWTIFAPTDNAFSDERIKKMTGLTTKELTEPANKKALTQLLQFHIVPSAALKSTGLKDGQKLELKTALEGAAPLKVYLKDGKVKVWPAKAKDGSKAYDAKKDDAKKDGAKKDWSNKGSNVVAADVTAGKTVVHVIDQVLIPASLRKSN